jgi:hypothetical protein
MPSLTAGHSTSARVEISHDAPDSPPKPAAGAEDDQNAPAVRFASTVEEIAPPPEAQRTKESSTSATDTAGAELPEVTPEELRALSKSLQGRHLQERRMNIFAFEPFSLPASRVCEIL